MSVATSLLLLFNHTLTALQVEDARRSLGVVHIHNLPEDLRPVWDSIPAGLDAIEAHLAPVRNWVLQTARPGDYTLIQGDFGATYLMVKFAFEQGLIPIYSTTERKAVEEIFEDGTVRLSHQFRHLRFRKYGE